MPLPALPEAVGAVANGARYDPAREWGDWLAPLDWTHCLTLTTRRPMPAAVWRERWRVFHRNLERRAQARVTFFWALECGNNRPAPHLHALLGGTGHLSASDVLALWKHGRADVMPYDATKGWARYVVKGFGKTWDVWDASKQFPPRLAANRREHEHEPNENRPMIVADSDDCGKLTTRSTDKLTDRQKARMYEQLVARATSIRFKAEDVTLIVEKAEDAETIERALRVVLEVLMRGDRPALRRAG